MGSAGRLSGVFRQSISTIVARSLRIEKDTPEPRPVQRTETGRLAAIPQVGGLHHRNERRAV